MIHLNIMFNEEKSWGIFARDQGLIIEKEKYYFFI